MRVQSNTFVIIAAVYFVWIALYSMFYNDTVFMDSTYYVIEDSFGVALLWILYKNYNKIYRLERMVILSIIGYKGLAIISEFLMFFHIFINADWWAVFAIMGLFSIIAAWTHLKSSS